MTSLGCPVVPELASHSPGESGVVAATGASAGSSRESHATAPSPASPEPSTTAARTSGASDRMAGRWATYAGPTTTAAHTPSATREPRSAAVAIVDSGTGTT